VIDLHCHLLPGVDDGSRSVEQSVQVLERMAADGIREICLTPHLAASWIVEGPPPEHDDAFARLVRVAPTAIKLHRGAEIMLDKPLSAGAAEGRRVTLAGTRYALVEFTRLATPGSVLTAVKQVLQLGLVPLLAHPERYPFCSMAAIARMREQGVVTQVDANTIFHPTGRGRRARQLLALGLADILAADNHGDERSLAEPFARLTKAGGGAAAKALMEQNPAAILADRSVEQVGPLTVKIPLWSRLKGWFEEMSP
jgi:protein-tyrosine phosphatase